MKAYTVQPEPLLLRHRLPGASRRPCYTVTPHLGFNLIRPVLTRPATRAERKLKAAVSCGKSKMVEALLYVHGNRRVILGRGALDGHLDFHTAPEL